MDQVRLREEFPVVAETVFFNHAAVSPMPRRACVAGQAVFEDRCLRASADYFRWQATVAQTRERAARLLGTTPDRVAFTGNTSSGLSLVAGGIDWRPGDRVAVTWVVGLGEGVGVGVGVGVAGSGVGVPLSGMGLARVA